MKTVICFGEALIDFLQVGSELYEGLSTPQFKQYPGGAPANAAVGVAKLGGNAKFLGQVGNDTFGLFLKNALEHYRVNTQLMHLSDSAPTALAFVSLDENNDRSFTFYRNNSADLLFDSRQISPDIFNSQTLLHFCSNTLTENFIAETTRNTVDLAHKNNSLVCMDVNLRHNLWPEQHANIQLVNSLVDSAHIVKFSRDEIHYLANSDNNKQVDKKINSYIDRLLANKAKLVIVTDGGNPIEYFTQQFSGELLVPKANVVDTTAAGDSFIGALLYGLSQENDLSYYLEDTDKLNKLIHFCMRCGYHTVNSAGAFPSLPVFDNVKDYWS